MYEEYQDHHWAAVRVPDDSFVVEGNSFRIADFSRKIPIYLCDPDLIPFAIKHGLWDRIRKPFNVSRAYGPIIGIVRAGTMANSNSLIIVFIEFGEASVY